MFSIAVLILTYKQSDVIGRTIDSVLKQMGDGLNEIIISDDHSPDNNWEIIQSYVEKYPNLIKAYRNNQNLGIYGNAMKLASIGCNSDLYMILDGDDELCPGWFESVQKYVRDNNIELRGTKSVIYSDFKTIYPDGQEKIIRPTVLNRGLDPLGLKLRELLFNRSFLATREVLEQYKPVDLEHGLPLAEELFDSQVQRFSENTYYHPYVGSIYHIYSGVTNDLKKRPPYEGRIIKFQTFLERYNFNCVDKRFLKFRIYQNKFYLNKKLSFLIKSIVLYVFSTPRKYGYGIREFVNTIGPMVKQLFIKSNSLC